MSRAGARQYGRPMRTSPVSPMRCAATRTRTGTSGSSACRMSPVRSSSHGSTANTHSIERPSALSGSTYSRKRPARGSGRSLARNRTEISGEVPAGLPKASWIAAPPGVPDTSRPVRKGSGLLEFGPRLPQRGFRDQAEHEEIPGQGEPDARGGRQDERVRLRGLEAGHGHRGRAGEEQANDGGQDTAAAPAKSRPT